MRFGTNNQSSKPYSHFTCSNYGQTGLRCSAHYIRYDTLYDYVLARIRHWSDEAQISEEKLLNQLLSAGDKAKASDVKKRTAELTKAEKRKSEVDRLFTKLYEDWAGERITEYNFGMLSQKYQTEQQELDVNITRLKMEITSEKQTKDDAVKWVKLIRQYVNPTELNAELLHTLIEKIVIHESVKVEDGTKEQEVEIYYRFIGKID